MIREGISFDLLRGINFISKQEGEIITCFSFDRAIPLTVVFNSRTRLISSIEINGVLVDITMANVRTISQLYANKTDHVDLSITAPNNRYVDENNNSDNNGSGLR